MLQRDAAEAVIQRVALQQEPVQLVDIFRGHFLRHLFCKYKHADSHTGEFTGRGRENTFNVIF